VDDRTFDKLERIDSRLNSIDKTLAEQHQQLKDHIRRTELAEENLDLLRTELKPVKEHVVRVDGVLKALGVLAVVLGILKTLDFL
jgi:hypothetical protein